MADIALRSQARTLADARAVIDAGKVLFCFSWEVWVSVEGWWVGHYWYYMYWYWYPVFKSPREL